MPGGALVLFDGGRIIGVEAGAASAPDGCEVLEAPGGTVLPGLIDARVHLCAGGTGGSLDRIEEPGEDAMRPSSEDLARLAEAGIAVCQALGLAGALVRTPNAAALLDKLGMTIEQVMEMRKRRAGQMHAAGVRIVSGSDGGVAAAKPHGLLPVSVAFLAEGDVSTVAALASATSLAAAACGMGDRKGRLRVSYDAGLLVVDGDPAADIGALSRPVAVFAGGRRPAPAT